MAFAAFLPLIQQGVQDGMQGMDSGMEHLSGLGRVQNDDLAQRLAQQRVSSPGMAGGPVVSTQGYGGFAEQAHAEEIARRRQQMQGGKIGGEALAFGAGALGIPIPPPSAISALTGTAQKLTGQGPQGAQGMKFGVF